MPRGDEGGEDMGPKRATPVPSERKHTYRDSIVGRWVFVRPVAMLYNEKQLRLRERRDGSEKWSYSQGGKDVNMKAEETTALKAVTRRRPLKIQQTKKT
jgi:hypothetical protein